MKNVDGYNEKGEEVYSDSEDDSEEDERRRIRGGGCRRRRRERRRRRRRGRRKTSVRGVGGRRHPLRRRRRRRVERRGRLGRLRGRRRRRRRRRRTCREESQAVTFVARARVHGFRQTETTYLVFYFHIGYAENSRNVLNSLLSMRLSLRFRSVFSSSSASIVERKRGNPSILLSCKCLVKFNTSFWAHFWTQNTT